MQLIHFTTFLALIPTLAIAGPVAPRFKEDMTSLFTRGIDICPSWQTRQVGQPCTQGSGDNGVHACGKVNPAAILVCRNRKWAVERYCPDRKVCACTDGHGNHGDITCH